MKNIIKYQSPPILIGVHSRSTERSRRILKFLTTCGPDDIFWEPCFNHVFNGASNHLLALERLPIALPFSLMSVLYNALRLLFSLHTYLFVCGFQGKTNASFAFSSLPRVLNASSFPRLQIHNVHLKILNACTACIEVITENISTANVNVLVKKRSDLRNSFNGSSETMPCWENHLQSPSTRLFKCPIALLYFPSLPVHYKPLYKYRGLFQ